MNSGPGVHDTDATPGAPALTGPPKELDLTIRPGESEDAAGLSQPQEKPYDPAPEVCAEALVATNPQPVTPERMEEFINRWTGLFAQAVLATTDDAARENLFPRKFQRQAVSPAFKLDRP